MRTRLIALAMVLPAPLYAQHDTTGASAVIVVDSLDRATFSNVVELLQGRVVGLTITRDGEGGLHWYTRGPASYSESGPLVLVNGVRLDVARPDLGELISRPSQLDEIDVENVDRIAVWTGPAAAARYGTGAGHGVIHITTVAPRAQATAWRLFTSVGAVDDDVTYPGEYSRLGTQTGGDTTRFCTLSSEATGACTPIGPVTVFNPLESESPFERALAARVGGAVTSMVGRVAWRGGATFDREGSTTGRLASQRLHLHGAASIRPTTTTEAVVRGYWSYGDADLPTGLHQSILMQGLFPGDPATWRGFQSPSTAYGSERYGATAAARWQLASWLESNLTLGASRLSDDDDFALSIEEPSGPPTTVARWRARRHHDMTARAELAATYSGRGLTGASIVSLERADLRREQEFRHRTAQGGNEFLQSVWSNVKTEISGIDLTQHVGLWGRATLTAGVRFDQVDVGQISWSTPPYPHLTFSWAVRRDTGSVLGSVRLRGGLGDAGNIPQRLVGFVGPITGLPEEPRVEHTREREAGIDIAAARDRLTLSGTWYTKRTSDVGVITAVGTPTFATLESLNRGIEGVLHTAVIATDRLGWDIKLLYSYNHNEVRRLGTAPFSITFDALNPQFLLPGAPLGAHRHAEIVGMQDLDGDGLLDDACRVEVGGCEVLVSSVGVRAAFPSTVASLETTVRLGSLTLAALLERRDGYYRANVTEATRCFTRCRGAYDAGAPLPDRARATAAQNGFGEVYVEDAGFVKLREIALHFAAPTRWAEALGASRLDISLAGRNVATWTNYSGLDPEAVSLSTLPLLARDVAATPIPRRLSIRVMATRD
jgi:hypothetical protein